MRWLMLLPLLLAVLALAAWSALTVTGCLMPPVPPTMEWPEEEERLKLSLRGAIRACESYRREIAECEAAGDAAQAARLREALRQTEEGVTRLRARIKAGS